MALRDRLNVTSLLLASTALLTLGALPQASAGPHDGSIVVAQAAPPAEGTEKDKKGGPPGKRPEQRPPSAAPPKGAPPAAAPPQARPPAPAAPPQVQRPTAPPPTRPAQTTPPATPPAAGAPKVAPTVQDRREERRDQRRDERRPAPPQAPTVQKPQAPTAPSPAPSTAQQPSTAPSTAQQPSQLPQGRRDERRQGQPPGRQPASGAPSTVQQPPTGAPSTAQQPPAAQQSPPPGTPGAAKVPPPAGAPATAQQPVTAAPIAPANNPAAVPPPTRRRDAGQFMQQRGGGGQPAVNLGTIKQERQETRQGDRVFIREPGRTIIREGDRSIIRHNESDRFAVDARDVRVQQRGGQTETVVVRPNGDQIVTITDRDGRMVRRLRRDPRGREIVIIDNRFTGAAAVGAAGALFLNLPPPVYRGPRERYILDYRANVPREEVYEIFEAPPIERIEQRYTLDQVRFNAPLRDRMPRVDLDVHFETGSWQLSPEQVDKLAVVAEGIKRAVSRNPREVFLIEGHTDAVGAAEDNLSLSDRRAESVAVALTEQFQVPAENLVTQGYGEQHLKEQTDGPSDINRRVAVRRITPLIDRQAQNVPPPRR
jgi:outer membrane protein OmpA-like peptidoglycan-associated protein